ncbi:bifunctional deaminase-reductase domain protein [Pseudopedobacter saltans DSM 12145]|uniref:Bifunctional deaminase-reductase domain protein n=1 Tax=Pseudopedobacter saltans (strain ATCC 51119 / DSM 12145 / JCM 21818 / CCUG 39354 / LMG 10337 / NBRC 100064 / NCIMB 13643) TaxID=762903 RepID=F0S7Z6_PSESL|nr:dihydrofolate reductase family protein [Pseudopedobacter saltans]ADY51217.1 bifunctional deaminase-reductase domain protein [Pseudopedobacter saltans DSM 12145]
MKKIIFAINVTLDGCCDHTKGMADDEIHEYFADLLRQVDVLIYGRKTYELMVPFWPDMAKNHSGQTNAINDFARAFDAVSKIVVFSRSLEKIDHSKTTVVNTNLREEILKLKQGEGKNILLGGVDLTSQIIELDLIDEYHFVVQPLIVGKGRRLWDRADLPERLQLKLIESRVFKSGAIMLRYTK